MNLRGPSQIVPRSSSWNENEVKWMAVNIYNILLCRQKLSASESLAWVKLSTTTHKPLTHEALSHNSTLLGTRECRKVSQKQRRQQQLLIMISSKDRQSQNPVQWSVATSTVATGRLSPPNWNLKHFKSVEFLLSLNVKPPCTNVKHPYWRLSGDGFGKNAFSLTHGELLMIWKNQEGVARSYPLHY